MKKLLCVNKGSMIESKDLQKGFTVQKALDSIQYFYEGEIPEDYVPLDIAISVRSAYTNEVVMCPYPEHGTERCFFNLSELPPTIHKGYDLVMFISSIAVMKMCNQFRASEVAEVMMHSKFDIIGLLNICSDLINPIVYSHVILDDTTIEAFKPLLLDGFRMIPISELPEHENFTAIKESLIIVKEKEDESESNIN